MLDGVSPFFFSGISNISLKKYFFKNITKIAIILNSDSILSSFRE